MVILCTLILVVLPMGASSLIQGWVVDCCCGIGGMLTLRWYEVVGCLGGWWFCVWVFLCCGMFLDVVSKKIVVCMGKTLLVDGGGVVERGRGRGPYLFMQVSSMHVLIVFMMYWNLSRVVSHSMSVICVLWSVSLVVVCLCLWPLEI